MEQDNSSTAMKPLTYDEMLHRLPPEWPDAELRAVARRNLAAQNGCVVVLDDDPTGTQTAHDVWVLTRWTTDDLRRAFASPDPAVYLLTNTRSLSQEVAADLNRQAAMNLALALAETRRSLTLVSRSDSTLRGHFPSEIEAFQQAWCAATSQSFDGILLVPFFGEGGRWTVDDVHWVAQDGLWVPVGQTVYARDEAFGFHSSRLPEWVEEKTGGRTRASDVVTIPLDAIRFGGPPKVSALLMGAGRGRAVVVNAASYGDLDVLVAALQDCERQGKRFLCRTAASFVKAVAGLADRPLLTATECLAENTTRPGLIVFGSHVPRSTAQLRRLLQLEGVAGHELRVPQVLDPAQRASEIRDAHAELSSALRHGQHAVLFTSRSLVHARDRAQSLQIARTVSAALVEVVGRLDADPGFVLGKGGITSSDLATSAMGVRAARVLGQILPGVPVWRLGGEARWPGIPYVVFPGNVGHEAAVADIVQSLTVPGSVHRGRIP